MYLNLAIIYGNLTRDPELKSLPSGTHVASFSVATNKIYKDKDGAKKEQVDFHNIVVFGRQAELAAQYLRKGRAALIEGRIQTRSWDAPDGQKRYRTEIVADRIQFGPSGGPRTGGSEASASSGSQGGSQGGSIGQAGGHQDSMEESKGDTIQYPKEEISLDDIPF